MTSTCTLRGRHGAYGTGKALVACLGPVVAVVAVVAAAVRVAGVVTLLGRRGTWWHRPSLCVAGVAVGDINVHFVWQAWHLATSTRILCGMLCTCGIGLATSDLVARNVTHHTWRSFVNKISKSEKVNHIQCRLLLLVNACFAC